MQTLCFVYLLSNQIIKRERKDFQCLLYVKFKYLSDLSSSSVIHVMPSEGNARVGTLTKSSHVKFCLTQSRLKSYFTNKLFICTLNDLKVF